MPITSATIVTDSQNVTIAKKAEVYHVHQNVAEKPTDNFKGNAYYGGIFLPRDSQITIMIIYKVIAIIVSFLETFAR